MNGRSANPDAPPLVTVGVVTHDRRERLLRALASARSQTWPALEILVVDNASTDGTAAAVREAYPEARLIVAHRNLGCPPARNLAMANMGGRFFASLDDDGELAPDAIERAMAAFDAYPDAGVVALNVVERDASWFPGWEHGRRLSTFPGGACVLRREVLERCGYYDDLFLRQGEEYDLSIRMHEQGLGIVYCPGAVMVHRPLAYSRETPRHRATEFVHKSLALYKHAPWSCVLTDAPRRTLGYAWLLTRMGAPWLIVPALGELLRLLPDALARRDVQPRGYRRVRELTRGGG